MHARKSRCAFGPLFALVFACGCATSTGDLFSGATNSSSSDGQAGAQLSGGGGSTSDGGNAGVGGETTNVGAGGAGGAVGTGGAGGQLAICGDNVAEGSEICDGSDLGGESCNTQGLGQGQLACTANCAAFDLSNCGQAASDCCSAHAGTGCGDLACESAVCAADAFCCDTEWDDACASEALAEPACVASGGSCPDEAPCGNGAIDGNELCDGALLGGADCVSQGFASGTLACTSDCLDFDTTGCQVPATDCCAAHLTPGCSNAACQQSVCAADSFCCNNQWDSFCANAADVNPACIGAGGTCPAPAVCGNGTVEGGESCDGANLNGQSCASQGFGAGTLACAVGCASFNVAGCGGPTVDCCAAHSTTGCGNPGCENAICSADPFCCNTHWDIFCADAAAVSAACVGAGASCP